MVSVLHRSRNDDAALALRVSAGDPDAFALLDARHRPALTRYARSLLRRSEHDAEDIAQDVLIRAHELLRAGEGPDELRPWLYRLTRNRAIDEVRRARWGHESLDDHAYVAHDAAGDPETMLRGKEAIRGLVDDLADLPVRQRTALLARELDGQSPEEVAEQLGVSVAAAQKLAMRARENLIKTRQARDADCSGVRSALLEAHERGTRPSEHGLRHVKGCDGCRAYQRDIRRLSRRLHALNPVVGLPLLAGIAKLVGLGGSTTAAVGAAAIAVAVVATGGIVVLESAVFEPGDPAPFRLGGVRDINGRPVTTGAPVPDGNVVVTTRIHVPAGKPARGVMRTVRLPCPAGMRYANFVAPEQRSPVDALSGVGILDTTIPGYSTGGEIRFYAGKAPQAFDYTVGILCRMPDVNGSVATHPRTVRRGERPGRVCTPTFEYVLMRPGGVGYGIPVGRAYRGQPVAIQRRARKGRWTRLATDQGVEGWVQSRALCG